MSPLKNRFSVDQHQNLYRCKLKDDGDYNRRVLIQKSYRNAAYKPADSIREVKLR